MSGEARAFEVECVLGAVGVAASPPDSSPLRNHSDWERLITLGAGWGVIRVTLEAGTLDFAFVGKGLVDF